MTRNSQQSEFTAFDEARFYVILSTVFMQQSPEFNSDVLQQLDAGAVVKVVGREGDWVKLENPPSLSSMFGVGGELWIFTGNDRSEAVIMTEMAEQGEALKHWETGTPAAMENFTAHVRARDMSQGMVPVISGTGSEGAPVGVVTLCFTDIKSSTRLWEHFDDLVMKRLLDIHNAVVRESLKRHKGYEVRGDDGVGIIPNHRRSSVASVAHDVCVCVCVCGHALCVRVCGKLC